METQIVEKAHRGQANNNTGAMGQSGLGSRPQAGSSYHVCVILGCEERQLYVRGRGGRGRLIGRQETSSVNQTREQGRRLRYDVLKRGQYLYCNQG